MAQVTVSTRWPAATLGRAASQGLMVPGLLPEPEESGAMGSPEEGSGLVRFRAGLGCVGWKLSKCVSSGPGERAEASGAWHQGYRTVSLSAVSLL